MSRWMTGLAVVVMAVFLAGRSQAEEVKGVVKVSYDATGKIVQSIKVGDVEVDTLRSIRLQQHDGKEVTLTGERGADGKLIVKKCERQLSKPEQNNNRNRQSQATRQRNQRQQREIIRRILNR